MTEEEYWADLNRRLNNGEVSPAEMDLGLKYEEHGEDRYVSSEEMARCYRDFEVAS